MHLAQVPVGTTATIERIDGERTFRRRLMELGLVPGTRVAMVGVAPFGDPLELLVRGASLSIRRAEANEVKVVVVEQEASEESALVMDRGCRDST